MPLNYQSAVPTLESADSAVTTIESADSSVQSDFVSAGDDLEEEPIVRLFREFEQLKHPPDKPVKFVQSERNVFIAGFR